MILVAGLKLEAVLAGSVSASQPEIHVDYVDWNPQGVTTMPATVRSVTTDATDVTILAAPVANPVREPLEVNVYNKDSASVVVTIKTDDGTTERIIVKRTLTTLQTLNWKKGYPWVVIATA